jgi:THO complex subunit 2
MQETTRLLPEGVGSLMRSPFFVTFWQLTLADIDHSSESYEQAIKRISQMEKEISGWKARVLQSGHFVQKEIPENRQEIARLIARRRVLESERIKQKARKEQTLERLQAESQSWFAASK